MHTQLSLYDYVSSITVPMGRYIAGLFYYQGNIPHYSRNDNGLWNTIDAGFIGLLSSCFFYCPNAGNGFEDKYFMQKGREKNECKKQKKCSEDNREVKTETACK